MKSEVRSPAPSTSTISDTRPRRSCWPSSSSSASSPSRRRSTPAFRRACRRAPPSPCRLPAAALPSRASLRRRSRSRRPPRRSRRLRRSRTRRPWRTARLLPLRRCAPPRRAPPRSAAYRPHRLTSRTASPCAGAGRGREQAPADHRHRRRRHAALDGLLRREPQAPRHENRERRQGRRLHEVVEPAPPVSGRRRLNHTPPRSR